MHIKDPNIADKHLQSFQPVYELFTLSEIKCQICMLSIKENRQYIQNLFTITIDNTLLSLHAG